MNPSEILRKAARMIEHNTPNSKEGACWAIAFASGVAGVNRMSLYECEKHPEIRRALFYFTHWLKPRKTQDAYWYGVFDSECQNARVVGLCLVADIAEENGE